MKQSLSVVPQKPNTANLLFLAVLGVFLLVCVASWFQLRSLMQVREDVAALAGRNAALQTALREERASEGDIPSSDLVAELSERIAWYNARIPAGAPPVLDHLVRLEETLGRDVRLSAFYYDRTGGFVTLSLLSERETSLLETLEDLQNSFAPRSVELERQVSIDSSGERLIQYEVKVSK